MNPAYPFSAITGNDELKRALLVNVVDPRIGGVLIQGDRGTAKTTIVRALGDLLPPRRSRRGCAAGCDPSEPCPFCAGGDVTELRPARVVELPLGATEDRVAGSFNLERALRSGEARLEPGLLASAHRGVLYVDEVNLLPDHLVDMLLDVAASGVNVVERDGQSIAHPARFVLVGTMNPEEGDLRPQLLDRFGLAVAAVTPVDPAQRAEIVRRRIAYDANPVLFLEQHTAEQRALVSRIERARESLPAVTVPAEMLDLVVSICLEAGVDGLRPDLAVYRTAAALAALDGRGCVTRDDVYAAALLALPHRQRRTPDGRLTGPSVEEIVQSRRDEERDADAGNEGGSGVQPSPDAGMPRGSAGSGRAGDGPQEPPPGAGNAPGPRAPDELARPSDALRIESPPLRARQAGPGRGRRRRAVQAMHGRSVGHARWDGRSRDIAGFATLQAAAAAGRPVEEEVRMHLRTAPPQRLVLLLVDGSGSMGARQRMAATKAALLGLIEDASLHRDEVALQVFREASTQMLARPTRRLDRVRSAIGGMPTGGRTPLADGLQQAARLLRGARVREGTPSLLVIATDGRYPGDLAAATRTLPPRLADVLVLDTEGGPVRLGRARTIAVALRAKYATLPAE